MASRGRRSQILLFNFSGFIFEENHVLNKEDNPLKKILIVKKKS